MAAKFFTGLPLDGPDPECVRGFGEAALAAADGSAAPRPSGDHSHRRAPASGGSVRVRQPVPVSIGSRPAERRSVPDRACDPSPLAGFAPPAAR
jgi:hypothetical protein